ARPARRRRRRTSADRARGRHPTAPEIAHDRHAWHSAAHGLCGRRRLWRSEPARPGRGGGRSARRLHHGECGAPALRIGPGMTSGPSARLGVDVGGTFTDLVLHDPGRDLVHTGKLLTTPDDPSEAIVNGTQRLLRETGLTPADLHSIVNGTTLVTNA